MSASDLDALCAKARCQRVVMTDAVTVGLHGGDQTRVLTVTARPEAGDGYRIQLTLEVLEGGIPVTIGGPWSVPDGSAASVSVPWGGGVRVAAKRVDGAQVRLLITEEGASPPS